MKEIFSMRLEKKLRQKLEEIAKREERSIAWIINQAIKEYLERRGK